MTKEREVDWIRNTAGDVVLNETNAKKAKTLLNETGPGFCLAKFTQSTLHLGSGTVHACHHPSPHKIPLDELEKNPNALFNTSVLKKAREEMLTGTRPAECDYCWRIEDNGGDSDRFYKSMDSWALSNHDTIKETGSDADYYPTYLEVDFSNACNFACTYCGPEFSSTWADNLKHNGPIKVLEGTDNEQWIQGWQKNLDTLVYKNREHNPYVDAFWKWFPEAYKHLTTYRITGGEPLLSKETFNSIDWLIENPNENLEFSINTNLGVPDVIWDKFIDKLKVLIERKTVQKLTIFTSVDAWGKKAEYIRPGLDFELFKKRYEQLVSLGNVRAVIMCAFNIFSITTMQSLLEWQVSLKKKYNTNPTGANYENETGFVLSTGTPYNVRNQNNPSHASVVGIDTPYVRNPVTLDAKNADRSMIQNYLVPALTYMVENTCDYSWNAHQGFEPYETEKFKRVVTTLMQMCNQAEKTNDNQLAIDRAKLYDHINELDDRHGRNFLDYFPEMTEFYFKCKEENVRIRNESAK
jgi:organic radical activating enzyme